MAVSKEMVTVMPASGMMGFTEEGKVRLAVSSAHLVIKIPTTGWLVTFRHLRMEIEATNQTEMLEELTAYEEQWKDDMDMFETGRRPRDLMGVVAGLTGVFNLFKMSELEKLSSNTREALAKTVRQVQAVTGRLNAQDKNIFAMMEVFKKSSSEARAQWVRAAWGRIKLEMEAFSDVAQAATQHKLHLHMLRLVKLRQEWRELRQAVQGHGWETALSHTAHLFNCRVSYWRETDVLMLVVHVPMWREGSRLWRLMRFRPLPVMAAGRLLEITGQTGRYLAIHNESQHFQILGKEDLSGCTRLAQTYYCETPEIAVSKGAEQCLVATWERNWEAVHRSCVWHSRARGTAAWQLVSNRFLVYSENTTVWAVECPTTATSTIETQAYQLVWVTEGCSLVSGEVKISMPQAVKEDEETVIVEFQEDHLAKLVPSLPEEKQWQFTRAQPIVDVMDQVQESMERAEKGTSPVVWIAIGLAGSAVVLMLLLLAIFYWKFRRAAKARHLVAKASDPGGSTGLERK